MTDRNGGKYFFSPFAVSMCLIIRYSCSTLVTFLCVFLVSGPHTHPSSCPDKGCSNTYFFPFQIPIQIDLPELNPALCLSGYYILIRYQCLTNCKNILDIYNVFSSGILLTHMDVILHAGSLEVTQVICC